MMRSYLRVLAFLLFTLNPAAVSADTEVPFPDYLRDLNWSPLFEGVFGEPTFEIENQSYQQHPTSWGNVYYTPGHEGYRDRVTEVADAVRGYYESTFGVSLASAPLDIYILPSWWREDVFGMAPDGGHLLFKPDGNETFGFSVAHELCHIFQRRVFGNAMDAAVANPWFIEGLTEACAYVASQNKPAVSAEAAVALDERLGHFFNNAFRGLYDHRYNTMGFWIYYLNTSGRSVKDILSATQSVLGGEPVAIANALQLDQHWVDFAQRARNKDPYAKLSFVEADDQPRLFKGLIEKGLFRAIRIDLRPLSFRYYKFTLTRDTGELVFFLQKVRDLEGVEMHAVIRHAGGDAKEDWSQKRLGIVTRTGKGMGLDSTAYNFNSVELLLVNKSTERKHMSDLLDPDSFEHQVTGSKSKEDEMVLPVVGMTGGVRSTRTIVSRKKFARHRSILQLEFKQPDRARNYSAYFWYLLDRETWDKNGVDEDLQAMLDSYAYFQGYVDFAALWDEAEFSYKLKPDDISNNLFKTVSADVVRPPKGTLIIKIPFKYLQDKGFMDKDTPNLYRVDAKTAIARLTLGGMGGAAAWSTVIADLNAKEAREGSLYDKLNGLFRATISLRMSPRDTRKVEFRIQAHKGRARWVMPLKDHMKVYFQPLYKKNSRYNPNPPRLAQDEIDTIP